MNCKIIPACEKDVPDILAMITELAIFENLQHEVSATAQDLSRTLFGGTPSAEVYLLLEDEQIAGMALFFHNYSTFLGKPGLYLEDMYIRPAYRGRGYGRKLLAFLANLAVQRGCGRFEWSVLDWNNPAIQLYKSLGAQPLEDWTQFRLTGENLNKLAASFSL